MICTHAAHHAMGPRDCPLCAGRRAMAKGLGQPAMTGDMGRHPELEWQSLMRTNWLYHQFRLFGPQTLEWKPVAP